MNQENKNQTDANGSPPTKSRNNKIFIAIIGILSIIIIALASYVILSQREPKEPEIKTIIKTIKKTPVQVKSFSPSGEVPQKTNFSITFSQNMVNESSVNVQLDSAPIEITPRIPGKYKWLAKHKLGFFPDIELYPSTEYNAEILPEICTDENLYLTGNTVFKFYTPRFKVKDSLVSFKFDDEDKNQVKIKAAVEFNYPVRIASLAEKLAISYDGEKNIPYQITTQKDIAEIIELETQEVSKEEYDKKIKLTINKELKCVNGTVGLISDYVSYIALKSEKPLQIEWISPEQQAGQGFISIRLSSPVNSKAAKDFITVTPETDYHIVSNYRYLELRGDFAPGESYTVSIKSGLQAQDESVLKRDYSNQVRMRDLEPSIGFVGDGIYLSKDGNLNVGLSTINVNNVEIEIDKVFANNLVYLIAEGRMRSHYANINNLGKNIYQGELFIASKRNEEVITPLNLKKYISNDRIGVYRVSAYQEDRRWYKAIRWVMITDLGIMAKKSGDELFVCINYLSSLNPVSNAEVTLISRNNQILLKGQTNRDGVIKFRTIKDDIGEFEPFIITASYQDDLSFIELNKRQVSTTDFDVDGKPVISDGYDAFVYTTRGVYRPGESVDCVAIVRSRDNSLPQQFPIKMQLLAPDNRILKELRGQLNREGACEFKFDIPEYFQTGSYIAKVIIAKNEVGRVGFNVEEFMPDRIKVEVQTDKDVANVGEDMQIDVEGMYLFGSPVAGGEVYADCTIEAKTFTKPQWSSFTFADFERKYERQNIKLGEDRLDEKGHYSYTFSIPSDIQPPSSLRGIIAATVSEPGGRAVSAYKSIDIHPYSHYVGIRRKEEGYAKISEDTEIEYIVVDHDGKTIAGRELQVSCFYIRWHSILRWRDGRYRYVSERQKELIKSFKVTSQDGIDFFQFKPTSYGEYKIEIEDKSGSSAATTFYASGWGYAPWAMENPDRLKIDLDKASYIAGDVAQAQIRTPFSGKLILTIEREEIYDYRIITMEENTAKINIPVTEKYSPNVYVSASLIRSTKSLERHAPARAFGVVPLTIDTAKNRLPIKLDTVSEIQPNKELTIDFSVGNQDVSYVTIAAVDEGICQLTNFKTPNPYEHFFAKRRLGIVSYDIYSAVLPEIEPATSSSSTGGDVDREGDYRKKHLSPVSVQRVKPVSLWSGMIETDEDGKGSVTFKIPQFNGSLRIMVVAFSGEKFGSISQNVIVREPIMLMPTYPRFISGGDKFEIPVSIFNHTGNKAEFEVKLEVVGPVDIYKIPVESPGKKNINDKSENPESIEKGELDNGMEEIQTLPLENGANGQLYWQAKAKDSIGKVAFNLSAKGGGKSTYRTTDVPLRPSNPPITKTGNGIVTEEQSASFVFPSDWLEGTTEFSVTLSAFPAIKFTNSLRYLVGYPYGCIEQTTSKLFPMLYFRDIVKLAEPELFESRSVDYYLEQGITKLESMQQPSGAFSYWPGTDDINTWGSIYASHFLVEARKAGYQVSERVYNVMFDALRNEAKRPPDNRYRIEKIAYACYVLSLAGKTELSSMLYLKNNKLNEMSQLSQFQLAGAFALAGDMDTAQSLIPSIITVQEVERQTGGNFNSTIRAKAVILATLAEVNPNHPSVPGLVKSLTESTSDYNRWYTTQENAFAFLALGKILREQASAEYKGVMMIDGQEFAEFDSSEQRFEDKSWAGKQVTLSIQGEGSCYYYWQAFGIPINAPIPQYDRDLRVRRSYLDRNGNPICNSDIRQGDVIISEIRITALTEPLENVIITDMLPAGLEIENPRLQSRAGISWIADKNYKPDYMDIRDDRLTIFGNFPRQEEQIFYYALRAVTRGDFVLPPVTGEAMYAPSKSSAASSGRINVE